MKNRNVWIIDADISRSAGQTSHPFSKNCRNFLITIKANDKKVCFDKFLLDEWKKHSSMFSSKWLASMIAKKKFKFCKPTIDLTQHINLSFLSDNLKSRALKDKHLIELAIENSKTIASGDEKSHKVFGELASNSNSTYQNIIWVNPRIEFEIIVSLLNKRVPNTSNWYITNYT